MAEQQSARSSPVQDGEGAGIPHLLVRVADVGIAMPAASALEIWQPERSSPVPGTPPYVIGIASFRGMPLPLLDLAAALGLQGGRPGAANRPQLGDRRAAVISTASYLVGLVVDATMGVVEIAPEQLRPPAVLTAGRLADFATAELEAPRAGLVAVLDLEAFLDAVRVRS